MKIAVLSRSRSIYSTNSLVEAAIRQGHEVDVVDYATCYMSITAHDPKVYAGGHELPRYDAVIPRIGASHTFFGTAVVRQFEMMGTYSLNESVAISRSRDKLRSLQLMARRGIGMPVTAFANNIGVTENLIDIVGGAPLVVKLLQGTQGLGVVLAETKKAAESVIDAFTGLRANILVQEYIRESKGSDIRCLVVGDKVVAAMRRVAVDGDFRANLHRGATAEKVKLTPEERSVAKRAARVMGLNLAGVDLLRSNHGPVVIEVNSSPGLEGVERTTGIDVAGKIITYLEGRVGSASTRTKGKG